METPTCVIDAHTFINHIHQIKALVYDGHIRLAVPSSTVDSVDQAHHKSIEPKPEPQKAARPKSGGKPSKVFPTFDINPRVAREFIERSKHEDSTIPVDIQKEDEFYTTWKNQEIVEEQEKQRTAEGKPATFAAALLAKLNIAEAPAQAPKGPVKPKLVARGIGAPNSPWKRPVPNITADGIPSNLRPLLSYLLWRLHERETYSFAKDPSILISDDDETRTLTGKLGIAVQDFQSLSAKLTAQHKSETDVAKWGEVEREFGVGLKTEPCPKADAVRPVGHAVSMPEDDTVKINLPTIETKKQEEMVVEVVPEDEQVNKLKIEERQSEEEKKEALHESTAPSKESQAGEPAAKENVPVTPRVWADVVSNRTRPVQSKPTILPSMSLNLFQPPDIAADKSDNCTTGLPDGAAQEKAITIADWVQQVKAAGTEPEPKRSPPTPHKKPQARKPKDPTPPPAEPPKPFRPILMQRTPNSSQIASDRAPSPLPMPAIEQHKYNGNLNHTPSASISSAHSMAVKAESSNTASSAKAPSVKNNIEKPPPVKESSAKAVSPEDRASDEPENSEDEVIVFKPQAKRMSQQQQATKRVSLEKSSVPKELAPKLAESPLVDTIPDHQPFPVKEAFNVQQTETTHPSPDRAGSSKNRREPKPRAPVVIDPDAFGRDFASNPRPHHHVTHPRSHPRLASQHHGPVTPRPSSQHGMPSNGIHQNGVLSNGAPPQRPVPQHGPTRGHPRGGRFHSQQGHLPPNGQAMSNGHNGYNPNLHNGSKKPNGYMPANEHGNKIVNGTNEQPFVLSRGSPPQELQPDKAGPDVDFILKSGSTRGSTRGRGRLFIP